MTEDFASPPKRRWVRATAWGLVVVGVVLAAASVWMFSAQLPARPIPDDLPWRLYAGSVLTGLPGAWLLTRGRSGAGSRISWLLPPIILLAVVLRVSELDSLPYGIWYDEVQNGVLTRLMATDSAFRPIIHNSTYTSFLHYALFLAGASVFGDGNIAGLRIISALFGVGSVIMAYLVGRMLRGEVFALLFAFVMACMRWSVNFSRIAMTGIDVTFFILLAFWALLRLARSGRARDALLAGAAVGAGLWFYRAFQLLLLPLAFYTLLVWRWRFGWRRTALAAGAALAALLIVAQPLLLAAVFRPEQLFGRVGETSIFNQDLHGRPLGEMLIETTGRHLGMFLGVGDANGRHNLPRAPMLDPVTGALFVMGLLIGLRYVYRRENIFFFLLIGFSLSAGILSIPAESPQALRSIGVLPAVGYFAALGGETIFRGIVWLAAKARAPRQAAYAVGALVVFALVVPILVINYHVYFQLQRRDYRTWLAYSTIETVAARWLQGLAPDTRVLVSPNIEYRLVTQYLVPEVLTQVSRMTMPSPLPVLAFDGSQVALLFARDDILYLEETRRLYPNARIAPINASDYGVSVTSDDNDALFYAALIPAEDIRALQGLEGGAGVLLISEYGAHRFEVPPAGRMTLDDVVYEAGRHVVTLRQGAHTIALEPADIALVWQPPNATAPEPMPPWLLYRAVVGVQGLGAEYYTNADWEGTPTFIRLEPFIYRYIHIIPLERPYSVIWRGSIYAPSSGEYSFRLRARRTGALRIAGQMLVNIDQAAGEGSGQLWLDAGWHEIEVRHQDTENFSHIYLEWMPPGTHTLQPVTSEVLRPPRP
jgi:4-amino-4-deoxy-L-arabinose transferase-like glycosyltransferase